MICKAGAETLSLHAAADRARDAMAAMSAGMLPALRREHVDRCSFERWYTRYERLTFRSELLELPQAFVEYLHADGLVLPHSEGDDAPPPRHADEMDTDEDDDADAVVSRIEELEVDEEDDVVDPGAAFPEVLAWIRAAIDRLGGAVLPKLNWSSPKDAVWISACQTLKCETVNDVLLLLKSSDYVAHDLGAAYEACDDSEGPTRPERLYLVLREWFDLLPSHEFRCFVRGRCLIGISQRDHLNYYSFLPDDAATIQSSIEDFFYRYLAHTFEDEDFCFDVYMSKSYRRVYLMDLNAFGTITEPLLFSWDELASAATLADAVQLASSPEGREALHSLVQMRVLTSEVGIQPTASQLNRLPKDFVDLSSGEAIDAFATAYRDGSLPLGRPS